MFQLTYRNNCVFLSVSHIKNQILSFFIFILDHSRIENDIMSNETTRLIENFKKINSSMSQLEGLFIFLQIIKFMF